MKPIRSNQEAETPGAPLCGELALEARLLPASAFALGFFSVHLSSLASKVKRSG